ncbi:MAG: MBL fold metallo-hydrolase, partial [Clostridia bacterium]|nr:MBL fold metallo-hydrolase [Clostridia bacterium]MBR7097953.1 MBL fold metallo-hydrolase [Clostridia bacterium]
MMELFTREFDAAYRCSDNVMQYLYRNMDPSSVEEAIASPAAKGYATVQDRSIADHRSVTLHKGAESLHLFYSGKNRTLTVTVDSLADPIYCPSNGADRKTVTNNSFSIMTLDYSKYTCAAGCDPRYDNNGLSYVITLDDGRFIVYDGGYPYPRANDDEILYEFMRDNNRREGKPVIAAWILTHSHNDHYGAFTTFTERFAHLVELETVVANTAPAYCYSKGHDATLEDMSRFVQRFGPKARQVRPHIGQMLHFGALEIEVLYTHEQFHFNRMELNQENSASLVSRIFMDGKTFFLPGDAMEAVCLDLVRLYGDYLNSDFMQIPHHGNRGNKIELYETVKPTYALWNTSKYGFQKRTAGIPYPVGMPHEYDGKLNHRIYTELGADHCWCADDEVDILSFDSEGNLKIDY